jgi:3-phytase
VFDQAHRFVLVAISTLFITFTSVVQWQPISQTSAVQGDADDPAIWIHPTHPEKSLILGTDKAGNALYVFDLNGKVLQRIGGILRPNNVDVEYSLSVAGRKTDIAVVTERNARRLRIFAIDPIRLRLRDISDPKGTAVFAGQEGDSAAPMGIALYRRPKDGAIFAIVSRKAGPSGAYLWQYRLVPATGGRVRLQKVREFGQFSGRGEIEAVAVDDQLGFVYYADENYGILKYHADPEHPEAAKLLAVFGKEGFEGDREGIAVYPMRGDKGYLLCVDQRPQRSVVYVFRREGTSANRHDHQQPVAVIHTDSDETDGIEATSQPLGRQFPSGLLIMMNSQARNFHLYRWQPLPQD